MLDGGDSVLFIVTERDDPIVIERIHAMHRNRAVDQPVHVVSRATAMLLDQLAGSGMVTLNVRATRVLHPHADDRMPAFTLSAAQLQRLQELTEKAVRRLKAARVLGDNGLVEEARQPLAEGLLAAVAIRAIRTGQLEPASLAEAAYANDRERTQVHAWLESKSDDHSEILALGERLVG